MPVPDPEKDKKRPSSIKVKSTTVKGKRGATTTTTTVAKKFKGTQGKNLGPNYKPSAATTAKANADKKKRTPPTSSKVTTVRKSKGVANVANASTRTPSSKLAKKPEKVTRAVAVARALKAKKGLSIQDRGKIALDIKKNFESNIKKLEASIYMLVYI